MIVALGMALSLFCANMIEPKERAICQAYATGRVAKAQSEKWSRDQCDLEYAAFMWNYTKNRR